MKKFDVLVTRHKALMDYFKQIGVSFDELYTHIEADQAEKLLKGKTVVGVLPHYLSCLASEYTELSLDIPKELRGKELSIEQIAQCKPKLKTYKVYDSKKLEELEKKVKDKSCYLLARIIIEAL